MVDTTKPGAVLGTSDESSREVGDFAMFHRRVKFRKKDGGESKFLRQIAIKKKGAYGAMPFRNDWQTIPEELTPQCIDALKELLFSKK
jgi:hypothetical protein